MLTSKKILQKKKEKKRKNTSISVVKIKIAMVYLERQGQPTDKIKQERKHPKNE
jgi:hypothetical protein